MGRIQVLKVIEWPERYDKSKAGFYLFKKLFIDEVYYL